MTPSLGLTDVKGFPLRRVFARYRNAWVVLAASVLTIVLTVQLLAPAAVPNLAQTRHLDRVQALTRRRGGEIQDQMMLEVADLQLDRLKRKVTRSGRKINLQPREFRLLEYLMSNAGQVVTRTMLLEKVWEYHFDPQTNVIDVHISRLRSKIDKDFDPPLIHTERGAGYSLYDPNGYN